MKVACPHCTVAYTIDDRRIPASGLNVRCPKCRQTFPVRKEPEATPPVEAAIPLPAPAAPEPIAPPPPRVSFGGAVPLPPPAYDAVARPATQEAAFAPPRATGAIPLPAPDRFDAAPPPAFEAPPPFEEAPPPFEEAPPAFEQAPFPPGEPPLPSLEDSTLPPPDPFAFSAGEFGNGMGAAEPLPIEPAPPRGDDGATAIIAPPRLADIPLPDLAMPQPPPGGDLGFGEVDLAAEAPPASGLPPLPIPVVARPPAGAAPGTGQEELEMLFGSDGGADPAKKKGLPTFKVRRRSGKVFGPFEQAQIVEMLGKGELMGNEDVSPDGGASWTSIAAVPAFGDALRSIAADPGDGAAAPAAPSSPSPFGDRMAAAKFVDGKAGRGDDVAEKPRWRKLLVPAAVLLVVLGVGVGAGFTKMGFFFVRAFRRGDQAKVAALVAEARSALQRAEYAGDRAALDAAGRALAADPDALDAAALHAGAVAILELRHGAPPGVVDQARRNADRLDAEEKGKIQALVTRLGVALATTPGAATQPQETALEAAAAKASPDPDVLALLARAALARGDAGRALALFTKLDALKPGTVRGPYGIGLALAAKRDAAGARAAFEKVLAATPGHLASRLELATLAEAAGDLGEADAQLVWLLAPGTEQKLAPAERARALALKGALLSRVAQKAAEADQAFDAAIKADDRLVEVRIAMAAHRLRRGDPQGAIAALEPLAAQAASLTALGAVRIRALAAAGRALDASSLADQALAKHPGEPALLLGKAAALEASGKRAEAAALFADAAARDPGAVEPHLALGRIALAAGELDKARAELTLAAERGPREASPRALLGELAATQGDADGAEKAYKAALALDPEYALADVGLAKLALAKGDDAAARAHLERALAVDPRSVEGNVQYGTLLWRAKDLAGAEKSFRSAVEQRPTYALAVARLGAVLFERGDVDGAVQRLGAATSEDRNLAEAHLWLGRALLKKGETPTAITELQKAAQLEPKNPAIHVALGLALERAGSLSDAIDAYRAATAADPRYAEGHERLGGLFFTNGRFEDAAAAYEKAVGCAPKLTRYRIALGDCRAKAGKHEAAIKIYREVLKLDPAAVEVVYRLARSVHEVEGAKAATPLYERAAKDDARNAMPHYYLGYLYKDRGQKARAVAEFKRFLELKPDADEKKDIEAEIEDLGGGSGAAP
jgi:predicted Zn finger-like uncharacterized protein